MGVYDSNFDFRLAIQADTNNIMDYLRDNLGERHILANDKSFFLWQYGNAEYADMENLNIVLMSDKGSGEIKGLNGFIRYSNDKDRMYVSSAITQISKDITIPLTGVELIKKFHALVPARAYFSSGTNPKTMLPIGKRVFGYKTGVMQQYYILNPQVDDFLVADIHKKIKLTHKAGRFNFKEISDLEELEGSFDFGKDHERLPYKSLDFLRKRYVKHPKYIYRIWALTDSSENVYGLLFGREITINGRIILRLVDYRGKLEYLGEIGEALNQLFIKENYEYIDLMASDLDTDVMSRSGFMLLNADGEDVVPNYFEPFVRENVRVHYQKSQDIVIFKADGDQDRPNVW
ncbi:MAG: hypothetical protein NC251_02620 [Lachnoclostridium sp.]|nr:hypothetical protein [Lachnospira sp.]MCM1247305.1 hypothetical protein [Lachnoclostridium sp.]MCM1534393.1 hypothetical protein [Clostridium sp.]